MLLLGHMQHAMRALQLIRGGGLADYHSRKNREEFLCAFAHLFRRVFGAFKAGVTLVWLVGVFGAFRNYQNKTKKKRRRESMTKTFTQ